MSPCEERSNTIVSIRLKDDLNNDDLNNELRVSVVCFYVAVEHNMLKNTFHEALPHSILSG